MSLFSIRAFRSLLGSSFSLYGFSIGNLSRLFSLLLFLSRSRLVH
jgi:hypothetical protein